MKAIVHTRYGDAEDALELRDVDEPTIGDGELLVRVRAASVNPYDWHVMTGLPYFMRLQTGLRTPKRQGTGADFAGIVEATGGNVTRFRPGDEVYGIVDGDVPGTPLLQLGTFAEYVKVSEEWAEPKPARLSFEEAAAVPLAALTALQGLCRFGDVRPGQEVLVNGASGGVGTFAVQMAKAFGARVTGVCSTRNVDLVRSLGADHVVDYTREDYTHAAGSYDLMLDNVGNRSLSENRRVVKPGGRYLVSFGQIRHRWLGPMAYILRMSIVSRFVGQTMRTLDQERSTEDLPEVTELIEAGTVTPVIDRTYPLIEAPDALHYLGGEHARGKVVVTA